MCFKIKDCFYKKKVGVFMSKMGIFLGLEKVDD